MCGSYGIVSSRKSWLNTYSTLRIQNYNDHRAGEVAGVGDGAGMTIDLPVEKIRARAAKESIQLGDGFASGIILLDPGQEEAGRALVERKLREAGITGKIHWIDPNLQLEKDGKPILQEKSVIEMGRPMQIVVERPADLANTKDFEYALYDAATEVAQAQLRAQKDGEVLPRVRVMSLSSLSQTFKGPMRPSQIPLVFKDLAEGLSFAELEALYNAGDFEALERLIPGTKSSLAHSRYSTGAPSTAEGAHPHGVGSISDDDHNGELNTAPANAREAEAIGRRKGRERLFPTRLPDSALFGFDMSEAIRYDGMELAEAFVRGLQPAGWDTDPRYSPEVRDMLRVMNL
ncbi:MAG: hypothetical protein J0L97_02455, partial [Alphaproteobacteria bacterium]|nr:hypothetical protein [Alphaproteobacteria bacterium]